MMNLRGLEKEYAKRRRVSPAIVALSDASRDAFQMVQKILKVEIILWHVNLEKEYYLFADSSDMASGSVLLQKHEEKLRPVAFHSQVFTITQRNYFASE